MKKIGQIVILMVAAISVFFTGVGVTIINCSCTSCDKQSVFMVSQEVCSSTGGHSGGGMSCCSTDKEAHKGCCGTKSETDNGHCSASRLAIDIDGSTFRPHVSVPVMWISDASFLQQVTVLNENIEFTDEYIHFKNPPDIPPREYLSILRVLII